jgi:hypothetical protein
MSIISFKHSGDFKKTEKLLTKSFGKDYMNILDRYGKLGVEMLSSATPVDTGLTAASWSYKVEQSKNSISVTWYNSNVNQYVNIALIIQYGHATKNGGWVQGRDYINPALKPIFDAMADAAWKEVTSV